MRFTTTRVGLSAFFAVALLFGLTASLSSRAALPAEVNGAPMPTLAPMLERVVPSVVNVNSKTRVSVRNPLMEDPFFRHFFGIPNMPQERIQQSLGSGVIVDAAKGYVLTNNHVIEGADDISVTLADGRTLSAEKVGADPETDVAVIRIAPENLIALPLADSSKMRVGDFVVAVGNPFGLGQTVTSGIVSALGRSGLQGLGVQNFIQTDASINPGNSGGALVNLRGELIGINTAIYSPSGGNVGIGFAIPATLASNVMRQLLAFGEVKRGTLGVQTQALDEEIAPLLKLQPGQGAVVTRVMPNSPAAEAAIMPGDVIVAFNNKPIQSPRELSNAEGLAQIGVPVTLKLIRDGAEKVIRVALRTQVLAKKNGADLDPRINGIVFSDLDEKQMQRKLSGVAVAQVDEGSEAARRGLQAGDIITAVNRSEIASVEQLAQQMALKPSRIVFTVVRGRSAFYMPF